jgi:hypothetical protein
MIGWLCGFASGAALLAGFGVYVCRGGPNSRGAAKSEVALLEAIASLEPREDRR